MKVSRKNLEINNFVISRSTKVKIATKLAGYWPQLFCIALGASFTLYSPSWPTTFIASYVIHLLIYCKQLCILESQPSSLNSFSLIFILIINYKSIIWIFAHFLDRRMYPRLNLYSRRFAIKKEKERVVKWAGSTCCRKIIRYYPWSLKKRCVFRISLSTGWFIGLLLTRYLV